MILFEGDLGTWRLRNIAFACACEVVRYLHDEGTEIAKGLDFWGSFQLKSSESGGGVGYLCFFTNDKFAKMPKVLESGGCQCCR